LYWAVLRETNAKGMPKLLCVFTLMGYVALGNLAAENRLKP